MYGTNSLIPIDTYLWPEFEGNAIVRLFIQMQFKVALLILIIKYYYIQWYHKQQMF